MTLTPEMFGLGAPRAGHRWYIESDESLYKRINTKYGMWGAFLGHAMECRGKELDDCAAHLDIKRIIVEVPITPNEGTET